MRCRSGNNALIRLNHQIISLEFDPEFQTALQCLAFKLSYFQIVLLALKVENKFIKKFCFSHPSTIFITVKKMDQLILKLQVGKLFFQPFISNKWDFNLQFNYRNCA